MPWPIPDIPTLDKPQPPIGWRWFAALVVLMALWAVGTLLLWPQEESATTIKFWGTLVAFPLLAWGALFGWRLHFYEQGMARIEAWETETCAVQQRWRQWGQESLTVLEHVLFLPQTLSSLDIKMPGQDARYQADRCLRLSWEESIFPDDEDAEVKERRQTLYAKLLNGMGGVMYSLSDGQSLLVHLLDSERTEDAAYDSQLQESFTQAWQSMQWGALPDIQVAPKQDISLLDDWLDAAANVVRLVVITQIQSTKEDANVSEGAAALLLMPATQRFNTQAQLPRSMTSLADESAVSVQQLLDTQRDGPPFLDLWLTQLSNQQSRALLNALQEADVDVWRDEEPGMHFFDHHVGQAGPLTPWLMLTAAIDSMADTPQLLASVCDKKIILNRVLPVLSTQPEDQRV